MSKKILSDLAQTCVDMEKAAKHICKCKKPHSYICRGEFGKILAHVCMTCDGKVLN